MEILDKNKRMIFRNVLFVIFMCLVASCARKVTRMGTEVQVDISGRWNDTDSRLASYTLIKDVLERPWLQLFKQRKERNPVVIIGNVVNKSHEHISTDALIKDVEREFVNSGTVRVVANAVFRGKIREERVDQWDNVTAGTQKRFGKELGVDYMLFGTVTSIVDEYRRKRVVLYKINLELIDLETNEKVWIGNKEIKKFIKN